MRMRQRPWAVVVVVPARDEEAWIDRCLDSVRDSVTAAVERGLVDAWAVVLVANHCADATVALGQLALTGAPSRIVVDDRSTTVGAVRGIGVRAGVDELRSRGWVVDPRRALVLSTDADSVVPITWVRDVVDHAERGAEAVVGMAALDNEPALRPSARNAYRKIIEAGLHGRTHDHVYGANLAVRLDAYLRVGGFQPVAVGEDHALVEALRRAGAAIARPVDLVVTTSGRRHGRAVGGLADLLARLDDPADAVVGSAGRTARPLSTARPAPAPGTS